MTWKLTHDNETIGEWSEDLIDKIAEKLKKNKSSLSKSKEKITQNEATNIIAEFLPDPIRDAFLKF
jgi:4-alpha-glucanotransferase